MPVSSRPWFSPSSSSTWCIVALLVAISHFGAVLAQLHSSSGNKSASDYFVRSLPGQPDNGPMPRMHAGNVEVDPNINANLFFWHFENKHIADKARTVIWLNGGPGCSSLDGALMEIGPLRVLDNRLLIFKDGAWNEYANLLFIDQPAGTGFSYVNTDSYDHEIDVSSNHLIRFMEKWFALFPQYETDELYIAGESFAGQFIPYFADAIKHRNKNLATGARPWNLQGILIGNGWVAPDEQYESYVKYAFEERLVQKGTVEAQQLENAWQNCSTVLQKHHSSRVSVPECETILSYITDMVHVGAGRCINIYDVRLTDTSPACGMNWPPVLAHMTPYLQRKEVTEALHINPAKATGWVECSDKVGTEFVNQKSRPSSGLLPGLLESGVRVLFFNGDRDIICNHIGNEMLIENLEWAGAKGWKLPDRVNEAEKQTWIVDDDVAGYYREARNLTYVLYHNASHMVPFDWPGRSLDMLNRFMGVSLNDIHAVPFLNGSYPSNWTNTRPTASPPAKMTGVSREATEREKERINNAMGYAYFQSAGVAILFVILGIGGWLGFQRLQHRNQNWPAKQGYHDIPADDAPEGTGPPESVSLTAMQGTHAPRNAGGGNEDDDFDDEEDDLEAAFEPPSHSRITP